MPRVTDTILFFSLAIGSFAPLGAESTTNPQNVYKKCAPSIVVIKSLSDEDTEIREGTGVYIAPTLVITNWHVIEGANKVIIKTESGLIEVAKTTERQSKTLDVALLEVPSPGQPINIRHDLPKIGEVVFTLGNAEGMANSFSTGIVSGIRTFESHSIIQTDARAAPGSSGGALLDNQGRLVGLVTALMKDSQFTLAVAVPSLHFVLTNEGQSEAASPLQVRENVETKLHKSEFIRVAFPSFWALQPQQMTADKVVIGRSFGTDGETTIRLRSVGVDAEFEPKLKALLTSADESILKSLTAKLAEKGKARIVKHYQTKVASKEALAIECELENETLGSISHTRVLALFVVSQGRLYVITYHASPSLFDAMLPDFRSIVSTVGLGERRWDN